MGAQEEGYSKNFENEVTGFLGGSAKQFVWQEIYWAKALEPRESDLWRRMEAAKNPQGTKIPLDWQSLRNFVVHNFGDALAYHRDEDNEINVGGLVTSWNPAAHSAYWEDNDR
jgi:hypothetical protein